MHNMHDIQANTETLLAQGIGIFASRVRCSKIPTGAVLGNLINLNFISSAPYLI